MRLPSAPNDTNKIHFLTDYYGEEVCELESIDFINSSENGFLKFYNKPKVQAKGTHFIFLWVCGQWHFMVCPSRFPERYLETSTSFYLSPVII